MRLALGVGGADDPAWCLTTLARILSETISHVKHQFHIPRYQYQGIPKDVRAAYEH